jgi:hypothetical protein
MSAVHRSSLKPTFVAELAGISAGSRDGESGTGEEALDGVHDGRVEESRREE